jgi:chemotaxis protein methyltransferase CheR
LRNISGALISKYFDSAEGGYLVKDNLRKMVGFKKQDLVQDRFDRDFDLIMCRNVVIYFSEAAKLELNRKFYQALKRDGIFFIGATETILNARDFGFERIFPGFYRKISRTPNAYQMEPVGQIVH